VAADGADGAAAGTEAEAASCVSDNTTDSRVFGGATFRLVQMRGDLVLTVTRI
jgi:hypothetical protein